VHGWRIDSLTPRASAAQQLAQLNTVPLRLLPAGAPAWQSLCDECFREVLGAEPSDDLKLRPIQHGRHSRR
jgi:hypothetical protein